MKKHYTEPDLEMRKVLSFEMFSTSGDEFIGEDNDLNVGEEW